MRINENILIDRSIPSGQTRAGDGSDNVIRQMHFSSLNGDVMVILRAAKNETFSFQLNYG
jgi:hypothetical protein